MRANASQASNEWWLTECASVGVLQYADVNVSQQVRANIAMFLEHIIQPLIEKIELARPKTEQGVKTSLPFCVNRGIYLLNEACCKRAFEEIPEGQIQCYGAFINSQFERVKQCVSCVEVDELYGQILLATFQRWAQMIESGEALSLEGLSLIHISEPTRPY